MHDDNRRIMKLLTGHGFAGFCRNNGIRLALLFGSRVTGRARVESDFDLAVLLAAGYPREAFARGSRKRELLHNLSAYLSSSRTDLVILNDASSFLLYQVIQTAKVLYEANPGEFARLASLAIRQYSDGRLFRAVEKKYLSR